MLDSLLRAVLLFISCVLALKNFVVVELLKIAWLSSASFSSAELLMLSQITAALFFHVVVFFKCNYQNTIKRSQEH